MKLRKLQRRLQYTALFHVVCRVTVIIFCSRCDGSLDQWPFAHLCLKAFCNLCRATLYNNRERVNKNIEQRSRQVSKPLNFNNLVLPKSFLCTSHFNLNIKGHTNIWFSARKEWQNDLAYKLLQSTSAFPLWFKHISIWISQC